MVSRIGSPAPEERSFAAVPNTTFVSTADDAVPDAKTESAEAKTHDLFATTESARLACREVVIETEPILTFTRGARVTDTEWVRLLKPLRPWADAGIAATVAPTRVTRNQPRKRAIF